MHITISTLLKVAEVKFPCKSEYDLSYQEKCFLLVTEKHRKFQLTVVTTGIYMAQDQNEKSVIYMTTVYNDLIQKSKLEQ